MKKHGPSLDPVSKVIAEKSPLKSFFTMGIDASTRIAPRERRAIPFVCSTEGTKRDGNQILTSGWLLENYLKTGAPVQWCHSLREPTIANAPGMRVDAGKRQLLCEVIFPDEGVYPFADQIYRLYSATPPVMKAGSVQWIPLEAEPNLDEQGRQIGWVFKRQELLEFSLCPVPADPDAIIRAVQQGIITSEEAGSLVWRVTETAPVIKISYDLPALGTRQEDSPEKGEEKGEEGDAEGQEEVSSPDAGKEGQVKEQPGEGGEGAEGASAEHADGRAVPTNVSDRKADEGTAWSAPVLKDFTSKPWGDLTASERRRIAGHFAWAATLPPEKFTDLKLPHHRPSDGAIVWRGTAAAMAALLGARGGVDIPSGERRRVYGHLATHYRAFDKTPPEFRTFASIGELDRALSAGEWEARDDLTLAFLRVELGKEPAPGKELHQRGEILDALTNNPDLQLMDAFRMIHRAQGMMMGIVYNMKPGQEENEDRVDAMLDEYAMLTRPAWLTIANSPAKQLGERSMEDWLGQALSEKPAERQVKEQVESTSNGMQHDLEWEISGAFAHARLKMGEGTQQPGKGRDGMDMTTQQEEQEPDDCYYKSFFEDTERSVDRITGALQHGEAARKE